MPSASCRGMAGVVQRLLLLVLPLLLEPARLVRAGAAACRRWRGTVTPACSTHVLTAAGQAAAAVVTAEVAAALPGCMLPWPAASAVSSYALGLNTCAGPY
jgi:hypothetical protein